jgi:hypothetical protein
MHPALARSRPPARSRRLTNTPKQTLITETRVRREERTQIVQPTLTSLDLTDNHIGKQGITEIAGRALLRCSDSDTSDSDTLLRTMRQLR